MTTAQTRHDAARMDAAARGLHDAFMAASDELSAEQAHSVGLRRERDDMAERLSLAIAAADMESVAAINMRLAQIAASLARIGQ